MNWDFPGGPVVENLSCNAGDMGLIPCRATKIPHTTEQQSLCTATTEPRHRATEKISHVATKMPMHRATEKISHVATKIPHTLAKTQHSLNQ